MPLSNVTASAPASSRILFQLNDGWALGADPRQWMLLRARKRHAQVTWQPVAFIASTKDVLRRCMRENGVHPSPDAKQNLDMLPDRFSDWVATRATDGVSQ
jgi:hypothetical protein